MSLASLFRWIPTPTYGKCGGAKKDCSPSKPRDEMDELFEQHDMNLYASDQLPENERKLARKEADKILYEGLRKVNGSKLNLYGKIYRRIAMVVFK